jgi:hypothetical protein
MLFGIPQRRLHACRNAVKCFPPQRSLAEMYAFLIESI